MRQIAAVQEVRRSSYEIALTNEQIAKWLMTTDMNVTEIIFDTTSNQGSNSLILKEILPLIHF
jgi:hypothetical protein